MINDKQEFSEFEYPELSSNMTNLGKNKKKTKKVRWSYFLNSEHSSSLESVFRGIHGVKTPESRMVLQCLWTIENSPESPPTKKRG